VTTAPIAVPTDSLLLSWVKNDTSATATALGGYTLDAQSTSFLWAESQTPISAGSYSGQFQYSSAIGWQAIVGLKPLTGPEAASQAVTTKFNTPVNITLTGISPQGFPLTYSVVTGPTAGTLSGTPPNLTYTPATGYLGHDSFTFKVNDGTTNSNTATVSITVQGPVDVVSTIGYLNGTPQTTHTSAAFNTIGSSTLVAFVSSHPSWNGLPVSVTGLSDSAGNTWSVLSGPTTWAGSQFTLMSAVYYVNAPITSATDTVTVNLSNPAPLVLHVFAVSGADVTGLPISSAITNPGVGGTSANVTTAPIAVPTGSLLLSWAKNETSATATAVGGFTLDKQQSTSVLWAEFEPALNAGTYTGRFQYNSAIGWQTAIVGLKPPGSVVQPVLTSKPANPTNQTSASFSFTDTQTGVSFLCQLDGSAFSACTSPSSYSGLVQGSHTFSVKAQDTSNNQSAAASFTWNIEAVIIAFDQVAAATPQSPTATISVSFPAAQSVGDLNIVVVGWNDTTSSVQSVNDSARNTYNLAVGPTIGTALQQSIYYAANIVGGSNTVTVTLNQAAAFPDVRILEYRGVTTLDAKAGASGNSTAANSGAATTTSAYELIFGADTVATSTTAAGSGFTSRIITVPDGDIAEDKIVTTAGSNSATATLSSAGPWVMQMVTFSFSPGTAPTVSDVSPNTGPTAGGTAVTITGTNFVTGATVTFGGTPATNVQVLLGTQITATTPAGSAGAATVTVTNPGGQNGSLSSGFTYLAPPTVSAVSPNDGPVAGARR
jgi:IPT/TIG domain/Bacterial Ig domain